MVFGSADSYAANLEWEYRRNRERYALINWAQQAFEGFRVVPPGMGICHQVNLEHLGRVFSSRGGWVFPDTWVVPDSHTLRDLVNHYDAHLGLSLAEQEKGDLIEYLKSL